MYLKKRKGSRAVRLPSGDVLTHADLPPDDTKRWVASRKLKVVEAIQFGLISNEEAKGRYALSDEEICEWKHALREGGVQNLKVTGQKLKNNLK